MATKHESLPYLTPKEVAQRIRVTESTLQKWRYLRTGPPFYKPSKFRVLYREHELEEWMETRRVETSAR